MYLPIGAEYFCTLIPNAKSILFDECGHFMAIDKPEEVAKTITTFYEEQYKREKIDNIINWSDYSVCVCFSVSIVIILLNFTTVTQSLTLS